MGLMALWKQWFISAAMPSQLWTLIGLLARREGGDRPIGMLATCIRILHPWLRGTYGNRWLQANPREYAFEAQGRSALSAAWCYLCLAEIANHACADGEGLPHAGRRQAPAACRHGERTAAQVVWGTLHSHRVADRSPQARHAHAHGAAHQRHPHGAHS